MAGRGDVSLIGDRSASSSHQNRLVYKKKRGNKEGGEKLP